MLLIIVLIGGVYGFALYVRDNVRAWKRYRATGKWRLWPEPMYAPERPDR